MRLKCKVGYAIVLILFFSVARLYAKEGGIHAEVDELILQRDFIAAEKKAKEYLKMHPNDAEGICALACVYRNQSLKSAISVDASAMGIKDGESGTYEIKGKSDALRLFKDQQYYDRKEYKKAEDLYYKIISIDPNYHNAYFNLLNDYVTLGEFDKYFKVINLFISNLKQKDGTPDYLCDLASKLYRKEYFEQAFKLYSTIVEHFPSYHQAKSDMGAVYSQQGQFQKAKEIFREVYKEVSTDIINLRNYYFSCVLTEDFKTGYTIVEKILALEKNEHNRAYDLVLLSILLERNYKSKIDEYLKSRAAAVKDINTDFWYQTAVELSKLDTYEKQEKISFLEYLLEQFNKAKYSDLTIIVANIIEQIEVTNYALIIHTSVFDRHMVFKKTIEYLDKIKKRRESNPEIMSEYDLNWNYGRNYYIAKKYHDAKNYLLRNHNQNKNDAKINYYLGKCYLFLDQKDEAVKLFKINQGLEDKEQMTYINYSIRELKQL